MKISVFMSRLNFAKQAQMKSIHSWTTSTITFSRWFQGTTLMRKRAEYLPSVSTFRYRFRYRYDCDFLSVCLIGADVGNINTRVTRFANYLRNLLHSNDVGVMELAAKTMGKLALVSGPKAPQYVEFEVKRAFEWLSGDRHEVNVIYISLFRFVIVSIVGSKTRRRFGFTRISCLYAYVFLSASFSFFRAYF